MESPEFYKALVGFLIYYRVGVKLLLDGGLWGWIVRKRFFRVSEIEGVE